MTAHRLTSKIISTSGTEAKSHLKYHELSNSNIIMQSTRSQVVIIWTQDL